MAHKWAAPHNKTVSCQTSEMKAGHSLYLQQGTQRFQRSMPAAIINSESNERERRCRQPVSVSIHNLVNSLSGQGLVAYNTKGGDIREFLHNLCYK